MADYGKRISYSKEANLMISNRIFTDGMKMVRVVIDVDDMSFKFIDPATGVLHKFYKGNWTNMEVLQRNVKRRLVEYLKIKFGKEVRKDNTETSEE